MSIVRIVHTIFQSYESNESTTMVVNDIQFSDRQLHLTGHLSLSICTGCTMAFSDRELENIGHEYVCQDQRCS